MTPLQSSQQVGEQDARNRAATYTQQAQHETDKKEQAFALQNSTDFQRMLWLKHLDQSYARDLQAQQHAQTIALKSAEFHAAMELETKRQQAALELRKLELKGNNGLNGCAKLSSLNESATFWESKLVITILTVSLPLIIPAIIAAILHIPSPVAYSGSPQLYRKMARRKRRTYARSTKKSALIAF